MVLGLLAGQAAEHASPNPDYYGTHKRTIDWTALFNERIYWIFLEVVKARAGVKDYDYERKKIESRRRRAHQYKLERRLQTAAAMIHIAKVLGNEEQYNCWSEIVTALHRLGIAGTSNDEEVLDSQGQQGIIVYEPAFCHPHFNAVFDQVDATCETEKGLFAQVKRSPPSHLPLSYYHPEYLTAMQKGLVVNVPTAAEEVPIPSVPALLNHEP
ncbi:hypothetical protein GG344DRAFT_69072 [Lentinula edodes]|nr:hypothetical protein GG344DRAFT_69072 [Lentinula edodes]